jgi:hypothetical protein
LRKIALRAWPYALAAIATIPIWIVRRPPIQDYPEHLAALRILHSFHDPAYGFDENLILALTRTQYVGYYFVGHVLAYVVGVDIAHRLLTCLWLGGAILSMRFLLRVLDRDERGCLFIVPLLYGPLFIVGLLPFLIGIPLLFLVVAACALQLATPSRKHSAIVAGLSTLLCLWHVVPYAIACAGAVAMARKRIVQLWAFAPSTVICTLWLFFTDAGTQVRESIFAPAHRLGTREAFFDAYAWVGDTFRDHSDEIVFGALIVLVLAGAIASFRSPRPLVRGYVFLPLTAAALYVVLARDRGFIWPLAQRFPMLVVALAIPLLAFPSGRLGKAMTAALGTLAIASVVLVSVHFVRFEHREIGAFDEALDVIGPRKKVASLIFDRHSTIIHYAPFLHFGSYYQAEKGGVVMFSFAGYNHWPVDFQPGKYPPPGGPAPPMWEWWPERVSPDRDLSPYFDFVLVRGPGFPPSVCYTQVFDKDRWSVYQRTDPACHSAE